MKSEKNTDISLNLLFLMRDSKIKDKLISRVISLHSATERCLDALHEKNGVPIPFTFAEKAKIIKQRKLLSAVRALNAARNSCAHKKPNFHEDIVVGVLSNCNKVIEFSKQTAPEIYKAAIEKLNWKLDAAVYVLMNAITQNGEIKIKDAVILDGFKLAGVDSINEKIANIIGDN